MSINGGIGAREIHYMHALQCLHDPRRPTGRTQPGRDLSRTTRAHHLSRPLLTQPAPARAPIQSAFSIGPNDAPRTPTRSARVPHTSSRTPRMLPTPAHVCAPPPPPNACHLVAVKAETRVSLAARKRRNGLKRWRVRRFGAAAHLLSRHRDCQKTPPRGRRKGGRHLSTNRSMAASTQLLTMDANCSSLWIVQIHPPQHVACPKVILRWRPAGLGDG